MQLPYCHLWVRWQSCRVAREKVILTSISSVRRDQTLNEKLVSRP